MNIKNLKSFSALSILGVVCGAIAATEAGAADTAAQQTGAVVVSSPDQSSQASAATIDYKNANPMPIPTLDQVLSSQQGIADTSVPALQGTSGISPGGAGTGKQTPVQLPNLAILQNSSNSSKASSSNNIVPQEFGTSDHPYTTSRVNAYSNYTAAAYPFRATGQLYFNVGTATYVCSASLVRPGVVLTAAHCVTKFGSNAYYSNWKFIPAYNRGLAPYGVWSGVKAFVVSSYLYGTELCAQAGVVCPNDLAVIKLAPKYDPATGTYYHAGNLTGWYGYSYGYGYGYNAQGKSQISQLGYSVTLDGLATMERTDSSGYIDSKSSNNTVIGSLQGPGSSGGPWLVNLGMAPTPTAGSNFGLYSAHNIVVGVTSWGYANGLPKEVGASLFTDKNIVPLINQVCTVYPRAC